jgi:cystathionine beta-lyase
VDPAGAPTCADVAVGVTEILRLVTVPGDGVVVMPPVYPPFWRWLEAVGAHPVEVPLLDAGSGGGVDLPGLQQALAVVLGPCCCVTRTTRLGGCTARRSCGRWPT